MCDVWTGPAAAEVFRIVWAAVVRGDQSNGAEPGRAPVRRRGRGTNNCDDIPAHGNLARDLGADHVLDHTTPESLCRPTSYDLVFDVVGKQRSSPFEEAANRALARAGRAASMDDAALVLDADRRYGLGPVEG